MTTFDNREKAFENMFARDAEMQFKAIARRNKMVGLWAAELMGKTGEEAEAYAMSVVKADFEEPGRGDVVRKLSTDLGALADEATIAAKMSEMLAIAKTQIVTESR